MLHRKENIFNKSVAYNGAMIAIAAAFTYSLVVMSYVIIRSSLTIYSIMPSGERSNILLINGFSIAYSVVIFSIVMALLSSVSGAVTAVILKKLLVYFNPELNYRKAIIISSFVALSMLIILYILLYALLKDWMTYNYVETFMFWFIIPAAFFFTVCIIGGSKLNKFSISGITVVSIPKIIE
jgi:hypothetical protein